MSKTGRNTNFQAMWPGHTHSKEYGAAFDAEFTLDAHAFISSSFSKFTVIAIVTTRVATRVPAEIVTKKLYNNGKGVGSAIRPFS